MEWTSACQVGAYHPHLECQGSPLESLSQIHIWPRIFRSTSFVFLNLLCNSKVSIMIFVAQLVRTTQILRKSETGA